MDTPTWIGPIIGVVVGFALNTVYQYFREVWTSPRLIIDGEKAPGKKGVGPNNVYMKFRVRNIRKRTVARNCRAYVSAIQRISDGKVISNNLPDSAQLPWEGGDFDPRDIPHGHSQYCDIVHFSKNEPGWVFHVKPNYIHSNENLKNYRGIYRFSIIVAGDGTIPYKKELNIDYNGNWNDAALYDA